MKRTAICISGQVRNEIGSLERVADALKGIDADIFISVWEKRGAKTFGGATGPGHMNRIFGDKIGTVMPRNWLGRMRSVFPDSAAIFPSRGDVTEREILEVFPDAVVDVEKESIDLSFDYGDSNSVRMLYKIWRCNGLKRAKERKTGERYDRVIRMRPDIVLQFAKLEKMHIEKNTIIAHNHQSKTHEYMQDIYWMSHSRVDDIVSNAFAKVLLARNENWNGIHGELFDFVNKYDIQVQNGNALRENIHDFAWHNQQYQDEVNKNFLEAVTTRNMNVDMAGGEDFCKLANFTLNKVISAGLTDDAKVNEETFLKKSFELAKAKPALAEVVFSLTTAFFAVNGNLPLLARFNSIVLAISTGILTGNEKSYKALIGAIPNIFKGEQKELCSILIDKAYTGETGEQLFDSLSNEWTSGLPKHTEAEKQASKDLTYHYLLESDEISNWIFANLDHDADYELVKSFAECRIENGVVSFRNYEIASHTCMKVEDYISAINHLHSADKLQSKWTIKANIGRLHLAMNKPESGKKFLQDALKLPDCKPWVANLLETIK